MAAVIGLADDTVEELCAGIDGVWPANFNSPGQVVVSGRRAALDDLAAKATAAGAKRVLPLVVSGAFHSPLIAAAQAPLRAELEKTAWRTPEPGVLLGLQRRVRERRVRGVALAPAGLAGPLHRVCEQTVCGRL